MQQVLRQKNVTAADRAALAELLRLEAQTSAIETRITEDVIADGRPEAPSDDLSRWEKSQSDRRTYLRSHTEIRARFCRRRAATRHLPHLQRIAQHDLSIDSATGQPFRRQSGYKVTR
jgi:hypothetical protein